MKNVLAIYALYQQGKLRRKGYRFPRGLSLKDFIFQYFDVWSRNVGEEGQEQEVVFFHMKSIDEKGRPISIPGGGDCWKTRSELFCHNPWLNWGCVFLSHKCPNWPQDDGYKKRRCILHTSDCQEFIGPKPIDCIFYTCIEPYECKMPSKEESDAWFRALAAAFPGSKERLIEIIGPAP